MNCNISSESTNTLKHTATTIRVLTEAEYQFPSPIITITYPSNLLPLKWDTSLVMKDP